MWCIIFIYALISFDMKLMFDDLFNTFPGDKLNFPFSPDVILWLTGLKAPANSCLSPSSSCFSPSFFYDKMNSK